MLCELGKLEKQQIKKKKNYDFKKWLYKKLPKHFGGSSVLIRDRHPQTTIPGIGATIFGQPFAENNALFPCISFYCLKLKRQDNYAKFKFLSLSRHIPAFPLFYIQGLEGVRLSGFKSRLRHHFFVRVNF